MISEYYVCMISSTERYIYSAHPELRKEGETLLPRILTLNLPINVSYELTYEFTTDSQLASLSWCQALIWDP
jgi:hypothetical protein